MEPARTAAADPLVEPARALAADQLSAALCALRALPTAAPAQLAADPAAVRAHLTAALGGPGPAAALRWFVPPPVPPPAPAWRQTIAEALQAVMPPLLLAAELSGRAERATPDPAPPADTPDPSTQ